MRFSFVVLTWNRYRFLEICLPALLSSINDRNQCEIIVMDNGSTDRTGEVLVRYRGEKNLRIIMRDRNYGIEAYKDLFAKARAKYVVVVDDDVLEFPMGVDQIFEEYMRLFPDLGMLALNVVQNEFTNGAKPGPERYTEVTRHGKTVEVGPTGGWCACFRRWHYQVLRPVMACKRLNMAFSEDAFLTGNLKRWLKKDSGIIRDAICFHATGGHYAQQFGHLDREIEKYSGTGLTDILAHYERFRDKADPPLDTASPDER